MLWAEGSVGDGVIADLSIAVIPGTFTLTSSADDVRFTLDRLGVDIGAAETRTIAGREFVVGRGAHRGIDPNDSATYVVPDFGYAMVLTFNAPIGLEPLPLADSIAATLLGC